MWEEIKGFEENEPRRSHRLMVPGGWLVQSTYCAKYESALHRGAGAGASISMIFVEDPNHDWKLEDSR